MLKSECDVKSLDSDGFQIVYEQGGRLHLVNPKTLQSRTLSISVDADLNDARPRWEKASGRNFTNVNISPNGERLVVEQRGEIVTIPKKDGTYRNITSWDPEWRNYRGGQAMPIWIVDLNTMELKTTPQPTKERHLYPVWLDGIVYYLSERDYTSNIWSYDPITGAEKRMRCEKPG